MNRSTIGCYTEGVSFQFDEFKKGLRRINLNKLKELLQPVVDEKKEETEIKNTRKILDDMAGSRIFRGKFSKALNDIDKRQRREIKEAQKNMKI